MKRGRQLKGIDAGEFNRLRKEGRTLKELAAYFQVSTVTLYSRTDLDLSKPAPLFNCCGLSFTSKGWLKFHRKGVLHRNYKRITTLLAIDCMSFDEIGKRVGVTRERMRQFAKILNVTPGNKRRTICAIKRHSSDLNKGNRVTNIGG